ncbi:hypothetical protein BC938DRAFT_473950 [Jimgerdemannia flammicorona]|uniref:Uncharacterized protein n=1 Tax=Jimgerdemannia flammicorona TaxID=994334 RepID=A0A433QT07_9FUNG|nr:hypothetical protein BC938DRAFT_473950 [Jimgerdemannia flammicorona]
MAVSVQREAHETSPMSHVADQHVKIETFLQDISEISRLPPHTPPFPPHSPLPHQMQKRSSKNWLLRLVGYTSLAAAFVSAFLYWYRKYTKDARRLRGRRGDGGDSSVQRRIADAPRTAEPNRAIRRVSSSMRDIASLQNAQATSGAIPNGRPSRSSTPTPLQQQQQQQQQQGGVLSNLGSRLLGGVMSATNTVRRKKKIMTISMKNTILWNPSSDFNSPNHAFHEHSVTLLTRLSQHYHIFLIIHATSDADKSQILTLLNSAKIFQKSRRSPTSPTSPKLRTTNSDSLDLLDTRKILFCSTEEGKTHMVRHLDPAVHIEGGWEMDDGEEIVRSLRKHVPRVIWCITRRRRSSFGVGPKPKDEGVVGPNVEVVEKIVESSVAREVGFVKVEEKDRKRESWA